MIAIVIGIVAQIFVIIGATAAFFSKMGTLTQEVKEVRDDVSELRVDMKDFRDELHKTSDKTIALEVGAKMKKAGNA